MGKTTFFTHDKKFYKTFLSMVIVIALQNLIAYSVNMVDNVMLGSYNQDTLSGAATVNQVFFVVNQYALAIANSAIVLCSQYWGAKKLDPIRKITGIALKLGIISSVLIIIVCSVIPNQLLSLFTTSEAIVAEGRQYLAIIQWTFVLFIISQIFIGILRSVGTVRISLIISIISLVLNAGINYVLIFGKFGFPEMGIKGAAIGTLIARIVEFIVIIVYVLFIDKKLRIFKNGIKAVFVKDASLKKDYVKVCTPIIISNVLWAVSVPMQTAILGHLSDDAIAANSVATTFYQYLKVITAALSSTSSVLTGNAIGRNDLEGLKAEARTLSVIDICIGVCLGIVIIAVRGPLLSLYSLSPTATELAKSILFVMGFIMMGMSYQMPVGYGIIQGGGDAKFIFKLSMISLWAIVMPLSFMAAFWWRLPIVFVVLIIQSDQLFKGIPTFIRFRSYKWIKKLTR